MEFYISGGKEILILVQLPAAYTAYQRRMSTGIYFHPYIFNRLQLWANNYKIPPIDKAESLPACSAGTSQKL